jgi:predicted AlkP superfamily phosphohydrolase/phosphomutase
MLITQADWSTTKAINVGDWGVFLNPNLDGNDYEKVRTQLIEEIKKIKDPKTGESLVTDVKRKEELYHGEHLELAPDLVAIPNEGYRLYDSILKNNWDYENKIWSAYHKLQGIFMAYGPDIRNGGKVENAKIYDLAPTILHMFQVPIPKDIDGRVLNEIFREDSELTRKETVYRDMETEKALIKKKIRKLKELKNL